MHAAVVIDTRETVGKHGSPCECAVAKTLAVIGRARVDQWCCHQTAAWASHQEILTLLILTILVIE